MNNQTFKLTPDGLLQLKKELKQLTEEKRPALVERLENARTQGDLSENSDYGNAKDELEFLDGRIDELESVLKRSEVIKSNGKPSSHIDVGTKVILQAGTAQQEFNIVGEWEADPNERKISPESPLGKSLMGKQVGDEIEVEAPAGKVLYKVLEIR